MLALDSMLHYHNIFDQLRNLVTMPSASGDDTRDDRIAADTAEPRIPAPAPRAKATPTDCASSSSTRSKNDILKAWEQSLPQGRRVAFGPLNGTHKENSMEAHDAHVSTTTTTAREPGTSHSGDVFAKLNPQSSLMLKPCATSESTEKSSNGDSIDHPTRRNQADVTILVAPSAMSAPHNTPHGSRHPRRVVAPEEGSLFDIIVRNPRTRLFVRPMGWVDDHTRHLNVTWDELPKIDSEPLSPATLSSYYEINNLLTDINRIFLPCSRNEAPICDVLPKLYPRSNLLSLRADPFSEMRLWFDSRVYRFAMRVECLWNWPFHPQDTDENTSFMTESTLDAWSDSEDEDGSRRAAPRRSPPHCGKPMLAYVGRDWLRGLRTRHMRVPPGPGYPKNEPVARLSVLQEKQLLPQDPERDPRFASILIAMAQEHVYPVCPAPARFPGTVPPRLEVVPEFRDVTVRLLVHDLEGDFIVYKATVTADYLRRFQYPLRAFTQDDGGSPGLEIEMTRVAESPRTGLRERLGAALGEEIVGPIFRDLERVDEGERLTPDTERWTPQPEMVNGTAENRSGHDEAEAELPDEVTPKAEANGMANGIATKYVEGHTSKPEEPSAPGMRLGKGSPVTDGVSHGKRPRDSGLPCSNGTNHNGSLGRSAKRRRSEEERSRAVPLSN